MKTKEELEKQAKHFIEIFGEFSLDIINRTRNGNLYHPSQEELFEEVEKIIKNKNKNYEN